MIGAQDGVLALAGIDLVVVDVETTGWVPEQATIIEIGAVRLSGGQLTGEFSSLVSSPVPVPAPITELTGITDAMIGRAPSAGAALATFLAFSRGCVLAAHNAPFDLGFLTAACRSAGLTWPQAAVLDTAVLARLVLGADQVPDCRLTTLAQFFATPAVPCHRALADAQATADVLRGLLSMIAAGRRPATKPTAGGPAASGSPAGAPAAAAQPMPGGAEPPPGDAEPRPGDAEPPSGGAEPPPPAPWLAGPQYATAAAGARVPGEPRRRPWSPLSS